MNQQNNFPQRGFFRNERKLLSDNRQRAYWIGSLQLSGAIGYLPAAFLFNKLMWMTSSVVNRKYTEHGNGTSSTSDLIVQNSALDAAFSTLYFWLILNVIRALLHIVSSVFVIWATCQTTPRLRAIRLCTWARKMNLAFLLYEIMVFVFIYQEWEFAFYFVLYRFWFYHEMRGLRNAVQMLSPPPPGHRC